jgi:hypothetical protein
VCFGVSPFYGFIATDLAQDIAGFRAMVMHKNAYPNLNEASAKLGLGYLADAKSTHLPTTFLFVAPVAFLPWQHASRCWAILMLLGLVCNFRVLGYAWPRAIGYGCLSAIWLPVMTSFAQFTILWLLLVNIAYVNRNKNSFLSGCMIGIASLIKLFPAFMIIPFVLHKKWSAVKGFILTVGIGLVSLLLISPQAMSQYMSLKQNIQAIILRRDNASLPNVGYQYLGTPGLVIVVFLIAVFLLLNIKQLIAVDGDIQEQSWIVWSFLSVMLLPVIWIYSLAPLWPILLNFIRSKHNVIKGIGLVALVMLFFGPTGGTRSVPWIAGTTLLIGAGTTVSSLSCSIRQYKESWKTNRGQNQQRKLNQGGH